MKPQILLQTSLGALLLACLLATAPGASARVRNVTDPQAPRALPAEGPVAVQWTDPNQFTEIRYSGNRFQSQQGNWVHDLAEYFRQAVAKQLPAGDKVEVTITDIKRAGQYEPWHGPRSDDIRVVKDLYPPRLSFTYTWTDRHGQVVAQGEQKLVDTAFLMNTSRLSDSDPLRYEKRMIDEWSRKQFRASASASR
ncbi:MAG TPA: DUF3016 domain-containing protein [Stenotrophomonas sp.]|jgi:hypothetical protein